MLFQADGLCAAGIEENVPYVDDKLMKQHEFLQDFYLYSAQFFAHMAFALVAALVSLATYLSVYGAAPRRIILFALLAAVLSTFFVLSRIQLVSLFRGERELVVRSR